MTIEFDRVKDSHALSDVVGRYVKWDKAKSKGDDYWACCPFHSERTPSFHVTDSKQAFHCFGCGVSGDLFDFLEAMEGKRPAAAAEMLGAQWTPSTVAPKKIAKPAETYVVLRPGSERIVAGEKLKVWNPKRAQWNFCTPSMVFPYCDRAGELIGYVIRIDTKDGKITPQVMWVAKDDGELCWAYAAFKTPRPMYGLNSLSDTGTVWMAEGEKAVDALHRMIGGSVLGWPGGTEGLKPVDWSPLRGRDVVMWRDNDETGRKCAEAIKAVSGAASFLIVGGEADKTPGWDAADAEADGWDDNRVHEWASVWLAQPSERESDPEEPQPETAKGGWVERSPFRVLGYSKENYYYLPHGKQQVVVLKAGEHTKLRLYQLAGVNFWTELFGEGKKLSEDDWSNIASSLITMSHHEGIFEDTRIRGRGAWMDMGRIIIHTGGEAIVNGEPCQLPKIKGRFIYEAQPAWDFGFGEPCTHKEAYRLVEICERLTWANKLSGALLAGWCVIAPISGALRWRPHIWITGPASSGKTTAVNDVVGRIVGPSAERADGKTTEAAIRQKLGYDARPVIIDEAEGEDLAGIQRIQGLLDLARVASSGGTISKGSASHKAVNFVIRSCFCFSSINTSVRHHADETRVSKLTLLPNRASDREQHYSDLVRDINKWLTTEFATSLFARTVQNLPTLLANIEVFTAAAAIVFGSRRAADQLGPMLAGLYLCHSTSAITLATAKEFIERHEWGSHLALEEETDAMRMFQYIMTRTVKVSVGGATPEMTIGSAIEEARLDQSTRGPYAAALGMRGIKIENDWIGISDSADNTRALFRDRVEWQSDWKGTVANLPGAQRSKGGVRFIGGINTRVTWVPYGLLDGSYEGK